MTSGVVYARLSDVRKGDTEGIDRQIREAEAHAAKIGVTELAPPLIDNDISAVQRKKQRPAFQRLMEGIAKNEWDVVVLRSLDRWVRVPIELEAIIKAVEVSKVKVEAIHGEIDLRTIQGRLLARMMTTVAMHEVETVQQRTLDWHADRAARGLPGPGYLGYGFNSDKSTINEVEAAMIRDAAERVLGGATLNSIVREWNNNGAFFRVMRRQEDGSVVPKLVPWRAGALKRVLIAPRTAGLRSHRGKVVTEGTWPAILDQQTYQEVVRILTRPERRTSTNLWAKLLTGLATCGKCDKSLNSKHQGGVRRYFCRHCFGTLVFAERLEEHVVADLFVALDSTLLENARRVNPSADPSETLREIANLEAELEALAAEVGAGAMTMTEWKIARAGINQRLEQSRAALPRPDDGAAEWLGRGTELAEQWDGMLIEEQRAILRRYVADVRVNAAIVGRNRFDGARVAVTWRD